MASRAAWFFLVVSEKWKPFNLQGQSMAVSEILASCLVAMHPMLQESAFFYFPAYIILSEKRYWISEGNT